MNDGKTKEWPHATSFKPEFSEHTRLMFAPGRQFRLFIQGNKSLTGREWSYIIRVMELYKEDAEKEESMRTHWIVGLILFLAVSLAAVPAEEHVLLSLARSAG